MDVAIAKRFSNILLTLAITSSTKEEDIIHQN